MNLTERDIIVAQGQRGQVIEDILRKVDKKDWGKKGDKFYDHVVDPTRDAELQPSSRLAAEQARSFLEQDRQIVIKARREDIRPSVAKMTEREWRRDNNLTNRKLSADQRTQLEQAVDQAVKNRVPDDWGWDHYLPQMHMGQWRVYVKVGGVEHFVGSGRTPAKTLDVAMEDYATHPELTPEAYIVRGRSFRGGDQFAATRGRVAKIVREIADAADGMLTPGQVTAFLNGTIQAKKFRTKTAGFLQKREGYEGYSKDITKVLSIYNQTFARWFHLRNLRKDIQPLIDMVRREGQEKTANMLGGTLDHLWGRSPSKATELLDASLQGKYSPVRNWVSPGALDRWSGYIKSGQATLFLKLSPKYHLLNTFQRYETLSPLLEGLPYMGEWKRGIDFLRSPEGRVAYEHFGIKYLTGGKVLEAGKALTSANLRAKAGIFAPETRNQAIAWATMYKRAKDLGYSDIAANNYAFVEGNMRSQFLYLKSDVPPALRGPIASNVFLFQRFNIKNLELGYDLIASKNMPGVVKWMGAKLLFGGARSLASIGAVAGVSYITADVYKAIKAEHGKEVADGIAFGLPGLVGLDMSGSYQLADTPWGDNIPEKVGNFLLSPGASVTVSALRAYFDTKGFEPSAAKRFVTAAIQRTPSLRWIEALQALGWDLDKGVYDFRGPAGRLKFQGAAKDIIIKALGGRTVTEGEASIMAEGYMEIYAERDLILDHLAMMGVKWMNGEGDLDLTRQLAWNELHPEAPIYNKSVEDRMVSRYKIQDLTRWERMLKRAPMVLRYGPLGR